MPQCVMISGDAVQSRSATVPIGYHPVHNCVMSTCGP